MDQAHPRGRPARRVHRRLPQDLADELLAGDGLHHLPGELAAEVQRQPRVVGLRGPEVEVPEDEAQRLTRAHGAAQGLGPGGLRAEVGLDLEEFPFGLPAEGGAEGVSAGVEG
ncbi:MAG: hypothetical protein ACK559_04390, partial [bacterium]